MTHAITKILSKPYGPNDLDGELGVAIALEISLPEWQKLEVEVRRDLAASDPFGILWWGSSLSSETSILIGDYLISCIESISSNLIEAKLHMEEYCDNREKERQKTAARYIFASDLAKFDLERVKSESPIDDLPWILARLHLSGFARAVSSVLDCLASSVIGVLGLERDILRAGFNSPSPGLIKDLRACAKEESSNSAWAQRLLEVLAQEEKSGWIEWVLSFRHMLVHRGRRIYQGEVFFEKSLLHSPVDGNDFILGNWDLRLPRFPGLSEINARIATMDQPDKNLLGGYATDVMESILYKSHSLIEEIGKLLVELWSFRRESPHFICQPSCQWRQYESPDSIKHRLQNDFGNQFHSMSSDAPDIAVAAPEVESRMRAASLCDSDVHNWRGWIDARRVPGTK